MKAREEIRENHKMRHNIWKKYLKIICSWILIFSICGLSLNVTEASGAGVEMERESQETVDFISDIENQETEPEILADDEQLSESEQIVESEKEPENPVEIEDSSRPDNRSGCTGTNVCTESGGRITGGCREWRRSLNR